jgi:pSer/pThr/pTyr-binding forkhead associated (FHA) protein
MQHSSLGKWNLTGEVVTDWSSLKHPHQETWTPCDPQPLTDSNAELIRILRIPGQFFAVYVKYSEKHRRHLDNP